MVKIRETFTWTPELAYVVGLIVTDGCLSSDKRHVIFTSQDVDLINTFSSILGLKNRIGLTKNKKSEAYRLQFGDVSFYEWLQGIGIMPNKSLVIGKVKIPDKYFIDFLRGHLDGDGSITTYMDSYNTFKNPKYVYERLFVRFISASKEHILWLHRKIIQTAEIYGRMHIRKFSDKRNPIYVIKFGKKDSLKLLQKIYYKGNLPCLLRKKKIADKFLVNK